MHKFQILIDIVFNDHLVKPKLNLLKMLLAANSLDGAKYFISKAKEEGFPDYIFKSRIENEDLNSSILFEYIRNTDSVNDEMLKFLVEEKFELITPNGFCKIYFMLKQSKNVDLINYFGEEKILYELYIDKTSELLRALIENKN